MAPILFLLNGTDPDRSPQRPEGKGSPGLRVGRSLRAAGTSSLAGELARLSSVTQRVRDKLHRTVASEEDVVSLLTSTCRTARGQLCISPTK